MLEVPSVAFSPVAGETLPELAAAQIYRAIIEGRQPPGSRLSEASIARAMQLSRGPIREGLRLLERKGLCEFRVRRGFFVKMLTPPGIDDLFGVRFAMERMGIEQGLRRGSDEALRSLVAWRERLMRADKLGPPQSPATLVEEDLALHGLIVALSGNSSLVAAFEVVLAETRLALSLVNLKLGRLARVVSHHGDLIDALLARDEARALAELEGHLNRSRDRILSKIDAIDPAEAS
ncbi:GntR family transcriptional regulator [Bosea sp. BH3]|uniref:GntR family transcriptional regulator n=1 Tax=Bosea sp. BH3 TaxID=2871701 RepID=UPI0021CB0D1A|nr:GntR family transcriptional regulator [Bosea sp. BH3]MCU4178348.1 GntR family transcriptional regulator [Bosea sp. BH3]